MGEGEKFRQKNTTFSMPSNMLTTPLACYLIMIIKHIIRKKLSDRNRMKKNEQEIQEISLP